MPEEPQTPAARPRLASWKEIAAHLGRSVRTVQRWERESGLPVHRYPTRHGEAVYATPEEVDAWLMTRSDASATTSEAAATSDAAATIDAVATRDLAATSDVAASEAAASALPANGAAASSQAAAGASGPPAVSAPPAPLRFWPRHRLAAGLAAVALLAFLPLGWAALHRSEQPSAIRVEGHDILAFDAAGAVLWKHALERPAVLSTSADRASVVDDLDGDGERELVVGLSSKDDSGQQDVLCLEANGTTRWNRRADRAVQYEGTMTGPPWIPWFVQATGTPDRRSLWVSWASTVNSGGFVERLNATTGRPEKYYWNPGFLTALTTGQLADGREVVLLGGYNNETEGASLAVYDLAWDAGSGPAEDARFRCAGCPPQPPLAFFVFPKTALSRAVTPDKAPIHVQQVKVHAGGFLVIVEHSPTAWHYPSAGALYYFDRNLRVTGAQTADSYHMVHQQLETNGKLDKPYSPQEDLQLFPVKRWDGANFIGIEGPQR